MRVGFEEGVRKGRRKGEKFSSQKFGQEALDVIAEQAGDLRSVNYVVVHPSLRELLHRDCNKELYSGQKVVHNAGDLVTPFDSLGKQKYVLQ